MNQRIGIFCFIYIMLCANLSYADITFQKSDYKDAVFVQVGAFKNDAAVEKIKKKLRSFSLIVQKDDDLIRVYAIESKRNLSQAAFLRKIKKFIPDAFVKKGIVFDDKFGFSHPNNIIRLKNSLNSETILRTRKRFF